MGPGFDRRFAFDGGCACIGPGHGEGDDDEQGVELVGLGDAGILDVEAPCLAVAEEAFDLPSLSIGPEGRFGGAVAGDDQERAITEAFGGQLEGEAVALIHGVEAQWLALQAL